VYIYIHTDQPACLLNGILILLYIYIYIYIYIYKRIQHGFYEWFNHLIRLARGGAPIQGCRNRLIEERKTINACVVWASGRLAFNKPINVAVLERTHCRSRFSNRSFWLSDSRVYLSLGSDMEPVALAVDKLKAFAKSSQYFIDDLIHRRDNSARRNPVLLFKKKKKN
jgi:hypothetical protein